MTTQLEHIIEHQCTDFQILEAAPATLPARVDSVLLKRHDANPLFVDLKIGKIGAQSRNLNYTSGTPRTYGREAWQSIVSAINERNGGVVGLLGHPDVSNRSGFESPVAVYWLQANIEADQTVTATAYFPPGPARDHVITAQALGMPVATSLYAKARETESGEIVDVELEQLDMVLHKSAGLIDAVDSNFKLHSETRADGTIVLHIPAKYRHVVDNLLKPVHQSAVILPGFLETMPSGKPIDEKVIIPGFFADSDYLEPHPALRTKQTSSNDSDFLEARPDSTDDDYPTVIIPGEY